MVVPNDDLAANIDIEYKKKHATDWRIQVYKGDHKSQIIEIDIKQKLKTRPTVVCSME